MRGFTLGTVLLVAFIGSMVPVGSPALAEGEFLIFDRAARVAGVGNAEALIRTSGGFAFDEDAHDFRAIHPPPTISPPWRFRDAGGVLAEAKLGLDQNGCSMRAAASAMAATSYEFTGDFQDMRFEIGSAHEHVSWIRRRLSSDAAELGRPVAAYSDDFHRPPITTQVPFAVGGGNDGALVVFLRLDRRDSGPTFGETSLRWEVFRKRFDDSADDERPIASGGGRVGPNENFTDRPTRFRVPRGHYLLRMTYSSHVGMQVISEWCGESVKESSDVEDQAVLKFELW